MLFTNKSLVFQQTLIRDDYSSSKAKLKMYYKDYPSIEYEVKKHFQIDSPNKIQITHDIDKKEIIIDEDKPELSWSTVNQNLVNIVLRTDSTIIDTLASQFNGDTFIFNKKEIISTSDSCFIQISDTDNKHFAFSKKFKITSPIDFEQINLKKQYLIGDTIAAVLNVKESNYYPIHVEICNEKQCYKLFSISGGNDIKWIIPDTVNYSEMNQLRLRTDSGVSVLSSEYFSIVPAKIVFRKNILKDEETYESYGAIPLIYDSIIFVSNSNLTAISTAGEIIWSEKLPNCTSYSSVVRDKDYAYVSVNQIDPGGNKIHTYDFSGSNIWSSSVASDYFAFDKENVNIQSDGNLIAYSPPTLEISSFSSEGEKLWEFDPLEIDSDIFAGGGFFLSHSCIDVYDNFYFTTKGKLIKINEHGEFIFSKNLYNNNSFDGSIIIGLDQKPIVVQQSGIDKYDSKGNHIWHSDVESFFQPVINHSGNMIVVSNESNGFYSPPKITSIHPSGKINWIYKLSQGTLVSAPVIGESENVYVLTSNQSLLVLSPTGEKLMNISLGDPMKISSTSPTSLRRGGCSIDKNGNIIVSTKEGAIYSISINEKKLGKTAWPKALNDLSNRNRQQILLSLELDSLNSNLNSGGAIKLKLENSDHIQEIAFVYREYDTKDEWKHIQLSSNEPNTYAWNFNDEIQELSEIEIKVYDTQNPGYCDFLEAPITIKGCKQDTLRENISICEEESYKGWKEPGQYSEKYVNEFSCDSIVITDLIIIELPSPQFTFNTDTLTSINSHASYQWYDQDGAIEGATSSHYIIGKSGTYYLEVTNENGCSAISDSMNVVKTGIDELSKNQLTLLIFPNPNDGKFRLRFETDMAGKYEVQVINKLGQVQFENEIYLTGNVYEEEFDLSHLSKGNYFIKVSGGQTVRTQKIIVH